MQSLIFQYLNMKTRLISNSTWKFSTVGSRIFSKIQNSPPVNWVHVPLEKSTVRVRYQRSFSHYLDPAPCLPRGARRDQYDAPERAPPETDPHFVPGFSPRRNSWKPRKTRPYSPPSRGPNSTPARPLPELRADRSLIPRAIVASFRRRLAQVRLGVVVGCYGPVCGCSGPFPLARS